MPRISAPAIPAALPASDYTLSRRTALVGAVAVALGGTEAMTNAIDPVHAAADAYLAARDAYEAIDKQEDDALYASGDAVYEKEEALARIVPTTRAGAERMVDIILKANDGFIGADSIEMALRSLAAAIPA